MTAKPLYRTALLVSILSTGLAGFAQAAAPAAPAGPAEAAAGQGPVQASAPGVPFTPERLSTLLPPTVYFQGQSAPLQIRNSGGTRFLSGAIVWVSLVDSSGYASSVQQRYQFYLVTEGPLRVGDATVPAGAYGGGFLDDRFLLMDLGGHTVAQGPIQTDADLHRPRPLQILPDSPDSVKLYLGRRWVLLHADPRVEAR
jgi:hypothetical protein